MVVTRPPWPPRKGDQLRAVQTLEALTRRHRVTLLAPAASPRFLGEPGSGLPAPPGSLEQALEAGRLEVVTYRPGGLLAKLTGLGRALLGGRPLQNGLFHSPDLLRSFRRLAPRADGVVIQLVRLAELVEEARRLPSRKEAPGPPVVVVDLIDSMELNVSRRADLDRPLWRPFLRLEERRLARAESRLLRQAERTVVVSPRDERWLRGKTGRAVSEPPLGGRLSTLPLAMAPDLPLPSGEAEPTEPTIALTGNLGYFPTAQAVAWWLERVWPELVARDSRLRLLVAGARPSRRLAQRVTAAPRATLVASPPNLRAVLAGATLAVAPLRAGSGVPVKILEAWAAGVPVVASPWAAAGTGAVGGEDLLLAAEPREWVDAVLRLTRDGALRRRLAAAGRRRLETDHGPAKVREEWLNLIDAAFEREGSS